VRVCDWEPVKEGVAETLAVCEAVRLGERVSVDVIVALSDWEAVRLLLLDCVDEGERVAVLLPVGAALGDDVPLELALRVAVREIVWEAVRLLDVVRLPERVCETLGEYVELSVAVEVPDGVTSCVPVPLCDGVRVVLGESDIDGDALWDCDEVALGEGDTVCEVVPDDVGVLDGVSVLLMLPELLWLPLAEADGDDDRVHETLDVGLGLPLEETEAVPLTLLVEDDVTDWLGVAETDGVRDWDGDGERLGVCDDDCVALSDVDGDWDGVNDALGVSVDEREPDPLGVRVRVEEHVTVCVDDGEREMLGVVVCVREGLGVCVALKLRFDAGRM
jgi:hypothetical protein